VKKLSTLLFCVVLAPSLLSAQQVKQGREHSYLKVGDKAPDFTLPATNNTTFKLSDYKGKKNVVLAFFPAAFTAG
jgi:peroxiredoxin